MLFGIKSECLELPAPLDRREPLDSDAARLAAFYGPFRFDAEILSRIRSEVTSRTGQKDKSTLSFNRPIEVVVLNWCVTETNDMPWASNSSTSLAKSAKDLVRRRTCSSNSDIWAIVIWDVTELLANQTSEKTADRMLLSFRCSHDSRDRCA
jgi:hypothetical protein